MTNSTHSLLPDVCAVSSYFLRYIDFWYIEPRDRNHRHCHHFGAEKTRDDIIQRAEGHLGHVVSHVLWCLSIMKHVFQLFIFLRSTSIYSYSLWYKSVWNIWDAFIYIWVENTWVVLASWNMSFSLNKNIKHSIVSWKYQWQWMKVTSTIEYSIIYFYFVIEENWREA